MLLIKARIQPSAIHGMGVVAVEFAPRGTPIWRFEPGFDRAFTLAQLTALPAPAQAHLRQHAYPDMQTGNWILSGDLAIFMNHAFPPNTGAPLDAPEPVTTVALRDIVAGEELTCDYYAFDGDAVAKLGPKSRG
jgi:SET domain-containing protein